MDRKLIIAAAGAGKTHRIVKESIKVLKSGKKVLVVTYTRNNQTEIINKFKRLNGKNRDSFLVKGLFTFLLEDIIRPYQSCIFQNRIETIYFNQFDPHKKNGRNIPGRKGIKDDGTYNPVYYLTSCGKKAHTTYLAKLASMVIKESKRQPIERLEKIYSHVYFDEVQDLIGWDYDVINALSESQKLGITCVGDFRQTIYDTAITQKKPKTSQQKLDRFKEMKFDYENLNISRRSIQSICDIADDIHSCEKYVKTESLVKKIPEKYKDHNGVCIVKFSDVGNYIKKYKPVLLRRGVNSCKKLLNMPVEKVNFGKSKGLGFNRVLVLPTKPYIKYLKGNKKIFDKDKTEESKNKLYVAMTRAKYSLGFIIQDKFADQFNLPIWENG